MCAMHWKCWFSASKSGSNFSSSVINFVLADALSTVMPWTLFSKLNSTKHLWKKKRDVSTCLFTMRGYKIKDHWLINPFMVYKMNCNTIETFTSYRCPAINCKWNVGRAILQLIFNTSSELFKSVFNLTSESRSFRKLKMRTNQFKIVLCFFIIKKRKWKILLSYPINRRYVKSVVLMVPFATWNLKHLYYHFFFYTNIVLKNLRLKKVIKIYCLFM